MSIFEFLVEMVGYAVARAVLPRLSGGRIQVQLLNARFGGFNALGYRREVNGQIEIDSTVCGWIGLVFCVVLLVAAYLLAYTAL